MSKATIVKEFTFDAAHKLDNHQGHCRNLHGHTYRLQVGVYGPIKTEAGASDEGMVMDFDQIKQLVKEQILGKLDHQYLNEVLDFRPTAENMAVWMVKVLRKAGLPVKFVRLYETPTSYIEVEGEDVLEE